MANIIVTLNIMPESPDEDLGIIESESKKFIRGFAGRDDVKVEIVPIAYGLKAVKIMFIMNENIGNTEILESEITKIKGVNSVEVTDVRRAIG